MKKSFGVADSLSVNGEISLPLVVIFKTKLDKKYFHGFIPGITKNDIVSEQLEECKKLLKDTAKTIINEYGESNIPFPFFPTKQELLEDFNNVCYISFIKIKSNKRKNNA